MTLFNRQKTNHRGFTLIETLVVILMLGVLAAIGIRQLFLFLNQQRVNIVRDSVIQYLKKAQAEAISEQEKLSVTFRLSDRGPVVAIYPTDLPESEWEWSQVGLDLSPEQFFFGVNFEEHTITFNSLGKTEDAGFSILVAVMSRNNIIPKTTRCVSVVSNNVQFETGKSYACGLVTDDEISPDMQNPDVTNYSPPNSWP